MTKEPTVEDWWSTSLVRIEPGCIEFRGYDIRELIGTVSFVEQIWLMLRGELPTKQQAALLEAALVAAVDHGPQAPSIAIARMAATCGVGINNAMASAINALGDIHGGAGQQAMELYESIAADAADETQIEAAAAKEIAARLSQGKKIEGFGHRFHPVDPRTERLMSLVSKAVQEGHIQGRYARIGHAVERSLSEAKKKHLPMNIDGVTAVIYSELGFPAALGRGLFVLSRSVGILAHAWEQMCQGSRIKGPMHPSIPYSYTGRGTRSIGARER